VTPAAPPALTHHHACLHGMAGAWDVVGAAFMGLQSFPVAGAAVFAAAHGGRFMIQEYRGAGGMTGTAIEGYDEAKGKHTLGWIDSMSTSMLFAEGTCTGEGCATIDVRSTFVRGGAEWGWRAQFAHDGPDRFVFTIWQTPPDGAEQRSLELQYTRKRT
jgi:hypothetical protein